MSFALPSCAAGSAALAYLHDEVIKGDAIIGVLVELGEPLVRNSEECFPPHTAIAISNMSWATA
jgi:hypothetical protein